MDQVVETDRKTAFHRYRFVPTPVAAYRAGNDATIRRVRALPPPPAADPATSTSREPFRTTNAPLHGLPNEVQPSTESLCQTKHSWAAESPARAKHLRRRGLPPAGESP